MIKIEIEIDPEDHGLMPQENVKELYKALNSLYCDIWCNACYDPYNAEYQKFAKELLPHIKKANDILKFKT